MDVEKMILRSRSIYTGVDSNPLDGFVVIEGERILDIKPAAALSEYRDGVRILDYGDQTIMPAFHDAHLHLIIGALVEKGGFLRDATSEEEAAKMFYERNKDNVSKWLLGGAWDHFKWPGFKLPSKASIDRYFPNQMVLLINKECHGAWANSKTLEYFGITKETPNPEFGEFCKDESGELTGYLHEFAYTMLLKKILAEMSNEELGEYVKVFSQKAYSYGITAVSDMQISEITGHEVYDALDKKGELDIRVHYAAPFTYDTRKLLELKEKHTGERLRFSGTKDFVDGTPMGYTGLMLEPYLDMPDCVGEPPAINLDYLREKTIELDRAGIRVRLHTCGDRAVREALDCFEAARKQNGNMGTRHTIEHIEAINPDDISRFKEIGVIASVQPEHLPKYSFENHPFHTILGENRMRWSWPFESLRKTGTKLAFGTDYCVSELSPFRGIYRAVTRLTDEGEPNGGFSPEEKMTLPDALAAYTIGSAWCNEREGDLGTLESGKFADIAVLDSNIFSTLPENLIKLNVAVTYFDGKKVFER